MCALLEPLRASAVVSSLNLALHVDPLLWKGPQLLDAEGRIHHSNTKTLHTAVLHVIWLV